jgi:hypothetical protein
VIDSVSSNGTFDPNTFFTSNSNRSYPTTAEVLLTAPFDLNNPNFLPLAGSPALTSAGTPPNDGFFNPAASFVGAFGSEDWTFGWAKFEPDSSSMVTSIEETTISEVIPNEFNLSQNYPNPFNPATKISYSITQPTNVKLFVYNVLGQLVVELVNDVRSAGTYEVNFDASNLSSGIYIYRLETDSKVISKKMTLLK